MNLVNGGRSEQQTIQGRNSVQHLADATAIMVHEDDTGYTVEHDGVMYLTSNPNKLYRTQDIMKVYHARNFFPKCSKAPKSPSFGVLKILDKPTTIAQFYCALLEELSHHGLVEHEGDAVIYKEVSLSHVRAMLCVFVLPYCVIFSPAL